MKKEIIILLIWGLFKGTYAFSQPINYLYNNKTVSKDYIISGKSKIKIFNCMEISQLIKGNSSFTKFCSIYKDSIGIESVSSLIIFKVSNNIITNTNSIVSDFTLNNIANEIVDSSFKGLKFKKLNGEQTLIGFYIHHIPKSKKFIVEFVEFKNDKYYLILKKEYDIE